MARAREEFLQAVRLGEIGQAEVYSQMHPEQLEELMRNEGL